MQLCIECVCLPDTSNPTTHYNDDTCVENDGEMNNRWDQQKTDSSVKEDCQRTLIEHILTSTKLSHPNEEQGNLINSAKLAALSLNHNGEKYTGNETFVPECSMNHDGLTSTVLSHPTSKICEKKETFALYHVETEIGKEKIYRNL